MREIKGLAKTIRQLLSKTKYSIDYYQREYKWETKHVADLIQDFSVEFLENFEEGHERQDVADYGHYSWDRSLSAIKVVKNLSLMASNG